ncbi:acyl-CoA dehydrogenase family protein [Micromonospora sp. NBRC 101691]|uniref:acyl-CoA dehydrogenase family protein n=1 Tax=Micromonospora sp. NBRC 101691 TaxID=3032198 RepID=UPI00249FE793|nr:acyl-CoA dehydrogenase family protein [Micromonospora sp. NBRC 101691]GLY24615.1 acyl-CoA dehydrogenase [Micromonospora sp. NBRC 101691]
MEFGFTAEQVELRDTVQGFLRRHATSERVRAADGFDAGAWRRLTDELGVTGLAVAPEHGGYGTSWVEVAVVLVETGAALLPTPYLSTVTTAAALDPDLAGDLLTGIAERGTSATLALAEPGRAGWAPENWSCRADHQGGDRYLLDGVKEHVLDGAVAETVVVAATCAGEPGLYAVRADDVRRTGHDTLDLTRPQARLEFSGTPARLVGRDGGRRALELMWLALAADSIGVARASLERTVEHLRTRQQFGVPLAHFQALRHRIADLAVALEAATSSTWYAVRSHGTAEFGTAAPLAKLVATDAAYAVTAESVQLHGGIGFTWEHDAHLYLRRATANRLLLGDAPALRSRLAPPPGH